MILTFSSERLETHKEEQFTKMSMIFNTKGQCYKYRVYTFLTFLLPIDTYTHLTHLVPMIRENISAIKTENNMYF